MGKKRIPIGVSDFKEIIERDYYYIDKSLFIREIVEDGSKVVLIPRPRRFGKTLNMSMLRYFFEKTPKDNSNLFKDLKIWEHEDIKGLQGKYPVIYLTLKDIKHNTWEDCFGAFKCLITYEFGRHRNLLESEALSDNEKKAYEDILWNRAGKSQYETAIKSLSEYLFRFHGEKVIILIDEYDTPIYSAWMEGYYKELITFIRSLLGGGLKDNPYVEKAILTGIMRIAKESIFSGLNNLKVSTIIRESYSDKFGFTEEETEMLLKTAGIESEINDVREWYNGYVFGSTVIYNPWSIINHMDSWKEGLRPHWVNTGGIDLIRDILTHSEAKVKQELEVLIKGGDLEKQVREDTVLPEIEKSPETIWSFLLFSGYLKSVETRMVDEIMFCRLKIPNREVRYVYTEIISYWANMGVDSQNYRLMLNSLTNGDIETFDDIFSVIVEKSLSYFDVGGNEPEKFYHAFVLGMMLSLSGEYEIRSNRESGFGRYDILMIPADKKKKGVIIEFKKVNEKRGETLETACEAALRQIGGKNYIRELEALGVADFIELGIAFKGKETKVVKRC